MNVTEVTEGIFRLSANAYTEDIGLFESLWPIPKGVSMSSYIVKGEKTAIVDGLCGWSGVPEILFEQFKQMKVDPNSIDYVIINHMEPDHSGWIAEFKEKIRSHFTIVTHEKAVPLLKGFYGINHDDIITVKDGSTLDLGNGRVLAFAEIPNVHWPETIATFDTKSGTLFPCDAFGSFGAVDDKAAYDDLLSADQIDSFEREAVRYYSNIVGAFSVPARRAIDKALNLLGDSIKIIAPGHGIVWRKNPTKIVEDYLRYTSYSAGPAKPEVTVLWSSMYGNTKSAVDPLVKAIEAEGLKVHIHRVPDIGQNTNFSHVVSDCWESSGVVIAAPSYEYKIFPAMAWALEELGNKKCLNRKAFHFGSFGWAPGSHKEIAEINERKKMHWNFLEEVLFKGAPTKEDIALIQQRGKELATQVKQWCNTKA